MPGTYPAAPGTLSGDLLTISRLLQSPTAIGRRLRDFRDLRFVSDQILTQRFRSSGGAVMYEQSESQLTDRTVEAVAPGSEYPFANLPVGTAAIAAIVKWGQKVNLTDEEINRSVYAGQALDRALRKVVNTIIKQVDTVTLAAVAAAVSQNQASLGSWKGATPKVMPDLLTAVGVINALNLGYRCDTVLMADATYAYLMADPVVTNAWRRETTENPVYTGTLQQVVGLSIIVSPNLPTADVWVLDSQQLGGMADETDGAPGYAVSDLSVEILSDRITNRDAWSLQGRRKTVPVVQEPGAATRITGTMA